MQPTNTDIPDEQAAKCLVIKEASIACPDAKMLLAELNHALQSITGASGAASFQDSDVNHPRAAFMIAYVDGQPVGCGAMRELSTDTAELKRVYARANHCGAAHKIVQALEQKAAQLGYHTMRLETRKVNRHAVEFYLGCGYTVTQNYGKYQGQEEAICFEKRLQ